MREELRRWRAGADAQLTPLQQVKDRLRQIRIDLDTAFPAWRQAYEHHAADYAHHDARREYFVSLQLILMHAQLSYVFMKEQLTDEQWWVEKAGEYRAAMAEQTLKEHALMLKFYSVHAIAMTTEETLRAIVRAGIPFTCPATAEFANVVAHVVRVTALQQFAPLFQLLRLVRNTIHNNGVHRPSNQKDESVTYNGRTFEFIVGQSLNWLGEDFVPWIAAQLGEAMKKIVESAAVTSLQSCPRLA